MPVNQTKRIKKIAIVGAGPTGICCAKNALEYGHEVTVYERNSVVGGTWIYSDQIGNDEYGQPIHSSMYKSLRYGHHQIDNYQEKKHMSFFLFLSEQTCPLS